MMEAPYPCLSCRLRGHCDRATPGCEWYVPPRDLEQELFRATTVRPWWEKSPEKK